MIEICYYVLVNKRNGVRTMEIALFIGLGIFAVLLIVGWIMFAMEHPFLALLISLITFD